MQSEQLEQQLNDLEKQLEQHTNLAAASETPQDLHTHIPKVYHNLPQPDYGRFVGRAVGHET